LVDAGSIEYVPVDNIDLGADVYGQLWGINEFKDVGKITSNKLKSKILFN